MAQKFITVSQIGEQYWVVEATGDSTQTTIEKKIELLAEGLYNYSKIAKKIALNHQLPFFKINETPQKKEIKQQRQIAKSKYRNQVAQKKQNDLKQQWLDWSKNYANEQQALAEGIWSCEQLARHLACTVKSYNEDYYFIHDAERDEDLMRLVQFNELKNLWIKRNHQNIVAVTKLPCKRRFYHGCSPGFIEFYQETFFDYFDSITLYLYEIKIEDKSHTLFSDKLLTSSFKSVETELLYEKFLPLEIQQKIGKSFGSLVPVIEWGARNFWQKYWSKKENCLVFNL